MEVSNLKASKNFYVIKSLRMMTYLIRQGFNIYKVKDDDKNSYYKVFLFEDSEDLRKAISDFTTIDRLIN